MKKFQSFFQQQPLRLLNHTTNESIFSTSYDAKVSFALEDAIATTVGKNLAPNTVRLWVHDPTLVLGIPDSRLHYLQAGVEYMRELQYDVVIRNSGGLAVLLDRNVLNISFILPNAQKMSIDDGYDLMYFFTQQLFAPEAANIKAYEIEGSYCPGDYDLSIDGKKFAGISQRRVRQGVAVQMYLDVAGSSNNRAKIVQQFYKRAKGDASHSFTYPDVNPKVMASLNELLQTNLTVQTVIDRIETIFSEIALTPFERSLLEEEKTIFQKRLQQMNKRNELIGRS